jgi:hypothetical protein
MGDQPEPKTNGSVIEQAVAMLEKNGDKQLAAELDYIAIRHLRFCQAGINEPLFVLRGSDVKTLSTRPLAWLIRQATKRGIAVPSDWRETKKAMRRYRKEMEV